MVQILHSPPLAGQNISEWAKQSGCRKIALETSVPVVDGFEDWVISADEHRSNRRQQTLAGTIDDGLDALKQVLGLEASYWLSLKGFCRSKRISSPKMKRRSCPPARCPA